MEKSKIKHSPFTLWVHGMIVRVEALESIIRKRLEVPDEEIQAELAAAALRNPLPDYPDAAELLNRFLSREDTGKGSGS